jgi:hypothetical protein
MVFCLIGFQKFVVCLGVNIVPGVSRDQPANRGLGLQGVKIFRLTREQAHDILVFEKTSLLSFPYEFGKITSECHVINGFWFCAFEGLNFRTGIDMPSYSKTYLSSWLTSKKKKWEISTLNYGAQRAFIQTGVYEKVMPMDILPSILAKSILAEDIEEMENLGILELAEEDVALCTYICPSKTDFGSILRHGLDLVEKEG